MHTASDEIDKLLTPSFEKCESPSFEKCESPSLRMEKFVCIDSTVKGPRSSEVKAWVDCHAKYAMKPARGRDYPGAVEFVAPLEANLIVNQAGGIIPNAGLCLDRFRGFPFIPGSALKGIARQAAWQEWRESGSNELALRIARVFGFQSSQDDLDVAIAAILPKENAALAGSVAFIAAVPFDEAKMTVDICTSHHSDYYRGEQEPYDNENPIPLFFPAVQRGAKFLFRIMPLPRANDDVLHDAQRWLVNGLCEHGVGAKTAAGYGWFSYDKQSSAQELAEQRRKIAEREQKRLAEEKMKKQRALEEAKKAEERQRKAKEAQRRATMSPDEIADEELQKIKGDDEFLARLGKLKLSGRSDFTPEERAFVRTLKGPRVDLWLKIKALKRGKNTPNWPQVVNDIYLINKAVTPEEKMP